MLSSRQFGDTYNEYVDKIYRFVFLKVNSQPIAQDLTSETFTKTLEYLRKNKEEEVENIQAFLYRTARNLVFDYYRQKSRQDVPLEYESKNIVDKVVSDIDSPSLALEHNEQIFEIKKALQGMEDEYSDIVTWHYVEDMSVKEISDILGRPEGTIRVMLHRGLKELRSRLE